MKKTIILVFILLFSVAAYADCDDGLQDGDEEGIDCGGSCLDACYCFQLVDNAEFGNLKDNWEVIVGTSDQAYYRSGQSFEGIRSIYLDGISNSVIPGIGGDTGVALERSFPILEELTMHVNFFDTMDMDTRNVIALVPGIAFEIQPLDGNVNNPKVYKIHVRPTPSSFTILGTTTERSLGWHSLDIIISKDGTKYYVDGVLEYSSSYHTPISSIKLVAGAHGQLGEMFVDNLIITSHNCQTRSIPSFASVEAGSGTKPEIEHVWVLPDESLELGTQVNIEPSGERDDIYACIVVSDAESRDSIEDVFIDIFHPDATFKYQVHANRLDRQEAMECIDLALENDLISSDDDQEIYYNIFSQPNWYMYKVYLPMYYHQPSGLYDMLTYAVDSTSRISLPALENFEWVAGTYLELDFDSVQFGNMQPGFWKILNGDLDMGTPDLPTLKNEGNTEVKVGLRFSEFIGQDGLPNKVVDDFDAQLRNMGADNYLEIPGEHLEFIADEEVWFTYPISLCRQEKIDFSIHADIGTVPDNYIGEIEVYAEPVIVDSPPVEIGKKTLKKSEELIKIKEELEEIKKEELKKFLPNRSPCTSDLDCAIGSCYLNICGLADGDDCQSDEQCASGICSSIGDICV